MEQLWQCVLAGKVDMIASDYSPHPFSKKVAPADHFENAAEGVTGLQTMLPLVLTEGALQPGFDADFILVDLDKEWTCHARYKTTKSAKGGER